MNLDTLFAIGYVAVFASLGAYICWNYGVAQLGAQVAGQYIHLMPLYGVVLAFLFLNESLTSNHWIAGLLIATVQYSHYGNGSGFGIRLQLSERSREQEVVDFSRNALPLWVADMDCAPPTASHNDQSCASHGIFGYGENLKLSHHVGSVSKNSPQMVN